MKIEKVEPSGHKQERVLVFLEGGDLLRVTQNELLHFGLCAGLDLDEATLAALRHAGEVSSARTAAADLLGKRPYSRRDLGKKLREKGADEKIIADTLDYLAGLGALDDIAYGKMLVRHYSAMGYGVGRLRAELTRHGISRADWDEILAEMPQSEDTLQKVILSRTHGRPLDEKSYKKLSDMLLRRGFPWHEVKEALGALGKTVEEEST